MTITSAMDDSAFPEDEALIDAVVHGDAATDTDPLATHLRAMRDELCEAPSSEVQWNHVAAMRRAARENRKRRRARSFTIIAAATVGVLGVTTGLAAADRLPAAVQDPVARVAGIVGIDLPRADDKPDVRPADHHEPAHVTGTTTGAGRVDRDPPPGNSANTPGHAGDTTPGIGTAPGNSGATPGHDDTTPGNSGNAPGQTGGTPPAGASGNSGSAPGHNKGGNSAGTPPTTTAPGNSGVAPGHNKAGDLPSQTAPGQLKKNAAPGN